MYNESLCCISETNIILLINYTPIENKNIETIFLEKKENTHTHMQCWQKWGRWFTYLSWPGVGQLGVVGYEAK